MKIRKGNRTGKKIDRSSFLATRDALLFYFACECLCVAASASIRSTAPLSTTSLLTCAVLLLLLPLIIIIILLLLSFVFLWSRCCCCCCIFSCQQFQFLPPPPRHPSHQQTLSVPRFYFKCKSRWLEPFFLQTFVDQRSHQSSRACKNAVWSFIRVQPSSHRPADVQPNHPPPSWLLCINNVV